MGQTFKEIILQQVVPGTSLLLLTDPCGKFERDL